MPGSGGAAATRFRRRTGELARGLARNYPALGGGLFLFLVAVTGVCAPVLTPYHPVAQDTPNRLQGMSLAHPLGTDEFGRDVFTRLLYGSRTTLLVGLVSVAFALAVGTVLGTLAGYYGGTLESVIMRAMDAMLSLPAHSHRDHDRGRAGPRRPQPDHCHRGIADPALHPAGALAGAVGPDPRLRPGRPRPWRPEQPHSAPARRAERDDSTGRPGGGHRGPRDPERRGA